ncbi:hypothetical protein CGLO_10918 [Colletotrichum gloeosporioides Cg-14]|uniref:Uncharacterized protein n=1 Tax=Colletotrichum gloeosporioides (strain Cg-14) TaxID=1237896 RepID=T0LDB4_COLGC|nr:hypothetical protein CGLO_10918 [Colletotrichum gloeosporioides Cg-14]
MAGADRFTNK